MSDKNQISVSRQIASEACAWVAQLDSGDLSEADLAALREWMSRSPAHAREIRAVAAFSGQLSVLTEMAEPMADAIAERHERRATRPGLCRTGPLIAAAMAAAVIMIGAALVPGFFAPDVPSTVYRTAVGEYRTIELEDGATVILNTDSEIAATYTKQAREITLMRGEALFTAPRDPDRPFRVYAGGAVAEAIGTSFIVRLREAVTELSVVEGVVAFAGAAPDLSPDETATANAKVILQAGQTMTSNVIDTLAAAPPVMSEREMQRKLSWTEGLFDFSGTPLNEVVEEFNRHNRLRIEIADAELQALKFGGIFRTSDIDLLLEALEGLGVEADRKQPGLIRLQKAQDD